MKLAEEDGIVCGLGREISPNADFLHVIHSGVLEIATVRNSASAVPPPPNPTLHRTIITTPMFVWGLSEWKLLPLVLLVWGVNSVVWVFVNYNSS